MKRPRTHRVVLLVSLVALPLLLALGCTPKPSAERTPPTAPAGPAAETQGTPAAEFSFTTTEGKTISLAELKGKPVLVNFWASWCHFCVQEAPDLEALYQQYHPQGLEVLGVGTDDNAALKAKAAELGLTYPVGSNPEAAQAYGVGGIPHTFLIDRQGEVVASLVGARPRAELEEAIKKVM